MNPSRISIRMEFFACPLCLEPYSNPKVLPCLHSFCDACLRKELPAQSFTLCCPVCRHQYILGPDGISSFQRNPLLAELSNLSNDKITAEDNAVDEDVFYCSSHAGQSLNFYCNDCDSAICTLCTDMEHREHKTVQLETAANEQSQVLQQILELSQAQVQSVETAKCKLEQKEQVFEEHHVQVLARIKVNFDELLQVLSARKSDLEARLNELHFAHNSKRARQMQTYEKRLDFLATIFDVTKRVLNRANPLYVILLKKQLEIGADLFKSLDQTAPTSDEPLPYQFHPVGLNEVQSSIVRFGSVEGPTDPPVQWIVDLSGAILEDCQAVPSRPYRIAMIAKASPCLGDDNTAFDLSIVPPPITVNMHGPLQHDEPACLRSSLGQALESGSQISISTTRSSDISGQRSTPSPLRRTNPSSCPVHSGKHSRATSVASNSNSWLTTRRPSYLLALRVRPLGNNTFETVLTFPQAGEYTLDIKLGDQPVVGSPWKIAVTSKEPGCVTHPLLMRDGSYISSSASSRRSQSGSPARSSFVQDTPIRDDLMQVLGSRGRSSGQFTNPQDVCVTATRIFASDSNNQSIQVFNVDGGFRYRFGLRGRQVGQLQRPTGIAAVPNSPDGCIFVSDYENRWVNIMEPNGKYKSRIGVGKLLGPKGVAADKTGKIYVVDNKASSICIFQSNGRFIGSFGSRGSGHNHLAGPHYLALNSFGHAFVSDFHNHTVKVFDSTGQFLYHFGSNGEEDGQFNAPTGIAIDAFDNVLVADWGNSRIQVFDRFGSFLQTINSSLSPLYGPQGLSLNPQSDRVFVADSGNHCIKVYKYENWVTNVTEVN